MKDYMMSSIEIICYPNQSNQINLGKSSQFTVWHCENKIKRPNNWNITDVLEEK